MGRQAQWKRREVPLPGVGAGAVMPAGQAPPAAGGRLRFNPAPAPHSPGLLLPSLLCHLGWSLQHERYYFHCGFVTLMPGLHQRHDPSTGALVFFCSFFLLPHVELFVMNGKQRNSKKKYNFQIGIKFRASLMEEAPRYN